MKKSKLVLILIASILFLNLSSQLSYTLSNKFWRLKYANIGGKEYSFNSSNDNAPTLQFSGGNLRGNGGCNAYHTKFTIDGNSLDIGTVMSTRMACNDMYLEEAQYFQSLSQAQTIYYTQGSNELKFINISGDQLIFFAQFTRSAESYVPPIERKSYREENDYSPRKFRHKVSRKLSKRELSRQRLLEKKLKSKKGKLSKRERNELKLLQNKANKGKTVYKKVKRGKKGKKYTKSRITKKKKSKKSNVSNKKLKLKSKKLNKKQVNKKKN